MENNVKLDWSEKTWPELVVAARGTGASMAIGRVARLVSDMRDKAAEDHDTVRFYDMADVLSMIFEHYAEIVEEVQNNE